MRQFCERKFWILYIILAITIIIALVFTSGCSTLFGERKTGGETSPTPMETQTEDITQVTQALGTSEPGAGGVSSGAGKPGSANGRTLKNIWDVEFDGDIVVWKDTRNFDDTLSDIYMYNIATKQESPLTVAPGRQESPAISGNLIAYSNWTDGKKIHVYDLNTRKDIAIPTVHRAETVDIDGKRVVFEDFVKQSIVMYDLSTGVETLIMANGGWPRFSGDHVIYLKSVNNRDDMYLYNIPNKKETCITCGMESQVGDYRIDGDNIVFDTKTSLGPLFLYNIQLGLKLKILPATIPPDTKIFTDWDNNFDISGNKVVFVASIVDFADKPNAYGIFVYDIPSLETFKEAAVAAVLSEKGYYSYKELARSDMYSDEEIGDLGHQILRVSGDNVIYNIRDDFHITEL
jgi:beta propeller repeat protein